MLARLGRAFFEPLESRVHLSVSRDPNGFTVVTAPTDARTIFVSAAGSDALDGRSMNQAVRSIARARELVGAGESQVGTAAFRTNVPDQILFRRGDTFAGRFNKWATSGRSAQDPFVIGAYTDPTRPSAERPKLHTGRSTGFSNHTQSGTVSHVYILGVAFEADQRDYREKPAGFSTGYLEDVQGGTYGINVYGSVNNLHVEDASFQYYRGGIIAQQAGGYARPANIKVRRTQLVDNYAQSFTASGAYVTSEGIFAQGVNGLALEENVFDHNGWTDPAYGNLNSFPTIYNHNAYIHTSTDGFSAIGNTFSNAASHGLQARAGGIVRNNLFVNNPIALSFGYVNGIERDGGVSGEVSGNVVYGSRDINGQQRGWGIELGNLRPAATGGGTVVRNNVFTSYGAQGQPVIQISFGTNASHPQYGVGINDLTIQSNIVYGWTRGISINPGLVPGGTNRYGLNNLKVLNNEFQQVFSTPIIDHGTSFSAGAESWSGNRYDLLNAGSSSTNYFRLKGTNRTLAQWQSQVEPTATTPSLSYPNANVSPASYNASIGGADSLTAYMDQARRQSGRFWRPQYTTDAVVNYMLAGFAGQRVDDQAPAAQLTSAPNVTAGGGGTQTVVVTWFDDNQVNLSSVGDGDVVVTGPGGYARAATLVSAVRNADGSQVTATYSVPAPGGAWGATANGRYSVSVAASQVSDNKSNFTPAGLLGSFDVAISAAAPTATLAATAQVSDPAAAAVLRVTYSVSQGLISRTSLDSPDLLVSGPIGVSPSTRLFQVSPAADAATIVATYLVDPPVGGWTSDNNGVYVVLVRDRSVAATTGALIGQAVLGTFSVDVTVPTALGTGPTITQVTTAPQTVTVAYAAAAGINAGTLDSGDVRIEGPNGYVAAATYVSRTGGGLPGNPYVVTYRFDPPAGGFNGTTDGTYTIVLLPDQVRAANAAGTPAPGGPVGTFNVRIDTEPPAGVSRATDEFKVLPGARTKLVEVVFNDATGVDVSSINQGDVIVIGPSQAVVTPTLKSVTGSGTQVTATFEMAFPNGITAADSGTYTVFVRSAAVRDVSGNATAGEGETAGEFRIVIDGTGPVAVAEVVEGVDAADDEVYINAFFVDTSPGIDEASVPGTIVRVTGPNGFNQVADLISFDGSEGDGLYASYRLQPPAGGWTFEYNGTHSIVLDGGRLADLSGNTAATKVLGRFTVNVPAPFVATVDPVPPGGQGPASLTIRFTTAAYDFDRGDLSLTRDGGPNLLPGSAAVLTPVDGQTFTLSGLAGLTGPVGQYVLRLPASSGVYGGNEELLTRDLAYSFAVTGSADVTPPTAAMTPVSPNPRATPVDAVTVTFSEPVTGFDRGDLVLTRDGGANLLGTGTGVTTSDSRTYAVTGLTAATTPAGGYVLTLNNAGTGIADAAGNALSGGATAAFTVTSPPTSPPPTSPPPPPPSAGGLAGGSFEAPAVGAGRFDAFRYNPAGTAWAFGGGSGVTGNGSGFSHANPAAPDGAQAAFIQMDGAVTQSISGLAGGRYTISLRAAQRAVSQASAQVVDVWVDGASVGTFRPAGTAYQAFATGGFDLPAGGHTVSLVGLNPAGGDNTAFVDDVRLTLVSPPPPPPTATGPTPELINAATDQKIATLTDGYVIDMAQTGTRLNIRALPVGTAGSVQFRIDGQTVRTESAAPYTIGGDSGNDYLDWTPPVGSHTLTVVQYAGPNGGGAVQGTTTLSLTVLAAPPADTTQPTATIGAVDPNPRSTPVDAVTVTFSEPVNGFDLADLTLTRSGGAVGLGAQPALATADGRTFTVSGLGAATAPAGGYVLTLKSSGTGIADVAGNPMTTGASTGWTVSGTQPAAPAVSGVSPNPVVGSTSAQNLVVNGSNFAPAATVTLRNLSNGSTVNATVVSRSGGTQITVTNVFGTTAANWTAQVLNGTTPSGQFQFAVGAAPTAPAKLGGAVIGTTGSYNNSGNTGAKAMDGSLSTYFDAPAASGAWVGLDVGSARRVTSIAFAPRAGWASRMVGGKFQASNTAGFTSGVVDLHAVNAAPAGGALTTINVNPAGSTFRYVRYLAPSGSYGNVAEVQFFGT